MQIFTDYLFLPIEIALKGIFEIAYSISGSYGVSLILLSMVVSSLLLPLYKIADSWRNKEKAHKRLMQADLDAIKAHYKGQERYYSISTAYRIYKYNPFMSLRVSVGFLIQIPFFFAAYHLLSHYPNFEGVSFGFIANLAKPDAILYGINILPIAMTIINIVAGFVFLTELTKNDTLQLLVLSLFFLVVLYNAPSALVLYWTMNNMYSLVKYCIINKPTRTDLYARIVQLFKQSVLHHYTSNAIKILLLTALYLLALYATHTWRSAISAINAIEAAIYILFPCIIALQAKCVVHNRINNSKFALLQGIALSPLLLAGMFAFLLLKVNYLSADSLVFFDITLSANRLRQLTVFFQLLALSLVYFSFHKISLPIYRIHKVPQKVLIRFYILAVLSNIITVIVASPIISYLSSPKDFGGNIYGVIIISTLLGFLLLVIAYIIGTTLKQIRYRWYYRLLIFFVWLSIVCISYGFIVQMNLGALHGLRFASETKLLEFSSKLFVVEPLAIIALYFILLRYFPKIRYKLTMLIGFTTLFLLTNAVWSLYNNSELFTIKHTIENEHASANSNPEELLPPYHNKLMSFSKEKNILYIILDAFPSDLMDKLLQEHPEFYSNYKGFTWYKNTVSVSPYTFNSVPAIIGGHKYTPSNIGALQQSTNKSIQEVWTYWSKTLPHYNISYINPQYIGYSSDFTTNTLNTKHPNTYSVYPEDAYFSYWKTLNPQAAASKLKSDTIFHIPKFININLFKIAPLHIKQRLYTDETWPLFITGSLNNRIYNTVAFYQDFVNTYVVLDSFRTSSNTTSASPTLKIYWGSVHFPFYMTKACDGVNAEAIIDKSFDIWSAENALSHMYCSLDSIAKWLEWMKQEQIYDNTKIIIASDHGMSHVFTQDKNTNYHKDGSIYALLMVKDFNEHLPLTISEQLMSNADIPSIISSAEPQIEFHNIAPDPIKTKRVNTPMVFYRTNTDWGLQNTKMDIEYTITVKGNVFNETEWEYSNGYIRE